MRIPKFLILSLFTVLPLSAQTLKPIVTQVPEDVEVVADDPDTVLDLRPSFAIDGVSGTIVRFDTILGLINVELFDTATPISVENFLRYVNRGSYINSLIHRVSPGFVIQGGGFKVPVPATEPPTAITSLDPIANEAGISNLRGTLAAARTAELDSATSEWFFNLVDNTFLDDPISPYAVFGRVIGNSIQVVDSIGQIQPYNMGIGEPFTQFPLINPSGPLVDDNYVTIYSIQPIPVYPTAGEGLSALTFTVSSTDPSLVTPSLANSELRLSYRSGEAGSATITVECADSDGNKVMTSFLVKVNPKAAEAPVISAQPLGRAVLVGGALTLSVGAESTSAMTYQWRRNGQILSGKTSETLVLSDVKPSDAGAYDAIVTDAVGTVTSVQAFVTVTSEMGYLTNLSTRSVTSVEPPFVWTTPGFVTRGSGTIDILVRAVGPGLDAFDVAGFLPDPEISLQMLAEPKTVIKANDDWEVNDNLTELKAAALQAGAFELGEGSKDSAVFTPIPSDAYTANILSVDGVTTGVVLGEIYQVGDPVPGGPALVNLSNRGHVGSGSEVMIGGFAVAGPGPVNLLIRGVGPTLSTFGVSGVLEDPVITVRDKDNIIIGSSDDWEDGDLGAALTMVSTSVGAFPLEEGNADAALLLVLDPGTYTAVLSGKSGGTGTGLIEFYLVE
jgi:cyclophilin family peptidyl-prolyl cis-trans isomerase